MFLDELMENFKPVYPQSRVWEDTFKMLSEDPVEFEVVQALVAELEKFGEFRDPVILSSYDEWSKYDRGRRYLPGEERDVYVPCVQDGTHRVYAHFLHGSTEVKTQVGFPSCEGKDFIPYLISFIMFPEVPDSLDEVWTVLEKARSFKVSDDVWVTANTMSSSGLKKFFICWDADEEQIPSLLVQGDAVNTKLKTVVSSVCSNPVIETIVIASEADENTWFAD